MAEFREVLLRRHLNRWNISPTGAHTQARLSSATQQKPAKAVGRWNSCWRCYVGASSSDKLASFSLNRELVNNGHLWMARGGSSQDNWLTTTAESKRHHLVRSNFLSACKVYSTSKRRFEIALARVCVRERKRELLGILSLESKILVVPTRPYKTGRIRRRRGERADFSGRDEAFSFRIPISIPERTLSGEKIASPLWLFLCS